MSGETVDINVEHPGGFRSWSDYAFFLEAVEESKAFESVPVIGGSPYQDNGFQEMWFRNKATGQTWRLAQPDAPFQGIWEVVNNIGGV